MTIERKVDELGRITDVIRLSEEENNAVNLAHSIIAERSATEGISFTTADKEHHGYMFLGILRYEGIDALLNFARTAEFKKPKKMQRGYA